METQITSAVHFFFFFSLANASLLLREIDSSSAYPSNKFCLCVSAPALEWETQSESTRLSDFLIIASLKFTKLDYCCLLFITKCLCYVFRKLSNKDTFN